MELINNCKEPSRKQVLVETAKKLLEAIESGEVRAFACVTIGKNENLAIYGGSSSGITIYQLFGALCHYQQEFMKYHDSEEEPVDA